MNAAPDETERDDTAHSGTARGDTATASAPGVIAKVSPSPGKRRRNKRKKQSSFGFNINDNRYRAIPIPVHKSDQAFKEYVRKTPYIDEIVDQMGKSPSSDSEDLNEIESNPSAGAKRLLEVLYRKYSEEFKAMAKKNAVAKRWMLSA